MQMMIQLSPIHSIFMEISKGKLSIQYKKCARFVDKLIFFSFLFVIIDDYLFNDALRNIYGELE